MLSRIPLKRALLSLVALLGLVAVLAVPAGAASHRDSPSVAADPQADQNDLYTFTSRNDMGQKVLNVIESYIPLEEAADGPNYYKFGDDIRYGLNIENTAHLDAHGNPMFTGKADISLNVYFHTHYLCTNTFLTLGIGKGCDDGASPDLGTIGSVGDAHQNLQQSYVVLMDNNHTNSATNLATGQNLIVPPDNIGRTTPLYNQGGNGDNAAQSGAQTTAALDPYTKEGIYTLSNGIKVFAGQRGDAFYADLAATFDLLNLRPASTVNTLQGYNVHVIAFQIPLSLLATPQCPNGECVMGMYITSSRRAVTVRPKIPAAGGNGDQPVQASQGINYNDVGVATVSSPYSQGVWRQLGRMGNPLFNEIFIGLDDKDFWNASKPDSDQQFNHYALNPEPARLLNAALGLHTQTTNRTDLAALFTPDLLKVDTSTDAVPLQPGDPVNVGPQNQCMSSTYSTLSVFGGDTIWSPFQGKCVPSGWPNGRRLTDDVVAIGVDAIAGAAAFDTGLSATAPTINHVFPFAATPFNGRNHQHAPR